MDDGSPVLEAGFVIDTSGSFDDLTRLDGLIDSVTANAISEFAKAERAAKGLDFGGAAIGMKSFGGAVSKEANAAERDLKRVEKQGEALVRQIERQNAAHGKTRDELRALRAEELAAAAAQGGNTDLAARIRAEAAAAAANAQAKRDAAFATEMFEAACRRGAVALREMEAAEKAADRDARAAGLRAEAAAADRLAQQHARLAAEVRASHAAQEADATSLDRLRASTDPLYAATKRLNDEIAESTRLYHAGVTSPAEYARQQEVLSGRLRQAAKDHEAAGTAARRSGSSLTQLSFQLNDVATQAALGQPPMQIFASQAGQIFQIAQMAEGGVKGFAKEVAGLTLRFLPLTIGAAAFFLDLKRIQGEMEKDAPAKTFIAGLGLTEKEIKKLKDTSVTMGDVFSGVWKTISDGADLGPMFKRASSAINSYLASTDQNVLQSVAGWYGAIAGTYRAAVEIWNHFPAVIGDLFVRGVSTAIEAMNGLLKAATDLLNGFAQRGNTILKGLGLKEVFGQLDAPQIKAMANQYATEAGGAWKSIKGAVADATKEAQGFIDRTKAAITGNTVDSRNARLKKQADALKEARTPKSDKHAEQLARDAEAIEAQIRNLYALADAYGVSGAAALIAEARVKAESKAIRQQADIEAAVSRQVQLAIAQRVSDAAKATASMRDQARVQAEVNTSVAAGLVPAARAAEIVRDRIADLPLLAAIEAAQQRGLATEAARATKVLGEQRDARARLNAETIAAQFNGEMAGGRDQLAVLEEELRLIGATDAARAHALATLKATQEAQAKGFDPAQTQAYVDAQVKIADATERNRRAQDGYNASLTFSGDMLDLIDQNAQAAAQGIADAFGAAGRAVGDALTAVTGYFAEQERMREAHAAAVKAAGGDQAALDRENAMFAARNASQQVRLYGTLASSAKGFFKEGSAGYKAMGAAEKVFRAIELANAVRSAALQLGLIGSTVAAKVAGDAAMAASDTARSGVEQGNSLATAAIKGVEAVVNAIRSLPFPANLAAGAATAAAIAALGVSIAGGFGGGKNDLPKANSGTGTVLGDSAAKSESIQRSLDTLRDIDDATLTVSRGMLSSLRSIESSIGGLSTLLVREGNINASSDVNEGFKTNAIGSVLSKIPVLGGLLGGLFGTKTKVIASGLYGGAQTLDEILAGGFDASYYSDVQKKKKLFGLMTSTKYRTEYAGADAGIEDQFTLLLRQFYDAIGQAAEPLGVSLDAVKSRLAGFTVDIGKIDLQGLTGKEIEEKLSAVFGAAADRMAEAALPGLARFQKVGEGAFETLVRVSSTVEQMDAAFQRLGATSGTLGIDTNMAIAGLFDSVADFTSAADGYLDAFYSDAERAAAETARMGRAFASLGLTMPDTLAGYRALVDAQDLTSAAGQQMYATLLQLAPAFAELKGAMNGAASAAAIVREREDLERRLLELRGDTAAIRLAELAKVDVSNRALQEQVYAIQDAQEAAKAAEQLRDAWGSVGDSITAEVKRIRGLGDAGGGGSFASLMGQFNTATTAATAGDMDAAKSLPQLSKSLLDAAALAATSRQELDRVQGQTASVLEAVAAAIGGGTATSGDSVQAAASTTAAQTTATADRLADAITELQELKAEIVSLRQENTAGHANTAGQAGRAARVLESVTAASGGDAIAVANAA